MNKLGMALAIVVLVGTPLSRAGAGPDPGGLEKLKTLVGEWEGKNREGESSHASYEIASDGSAVVEKLGSGTMHSMVTVYHKDGDRLMLTHYCGVGNQPRMRSEKASEPGVLRFAFVDATNLQSPDAGHMHRLALRFRDADHLTQEWTWVEKGQEKTEVIELARKK